MIAATILQALLLVTVHAISSQGSYVTKYSSGANTDYDAALQFLMDTDAVTRYFNNRDKIAVWNYFANLTEENKKIFLETSSEKARFSKEIFRKVKSFAWESFRKRNETIYRWFKLLSVVGENALPDDKLKKFNNLVAEMVDTYSTSKVCPKDNPANQPCQLSLEPELKDIFKYSRDYEQLKQLWENWRTVARRQKSIFLEYVELLNEAAKLNGFDDAGEMWRDPYETETFQEDVKKLWNDIEPFYMHLHAFVRKRLMRKYPDKRIKPDGPIPAHILGNMWAQTWDNIFSILKPFPDKELDVTKRMLEKKMTPFDLFSLSENFFTSLGLKKMTPEFWSRSIIEKPIDRNMVCHASSMDFFDGKDFRIKMCTEVSEEYLKVVQHEMGHIQYFQQFAYLPVVFRNAPNPGFHEAIGETLALSVSTTNHLKKIGLIQDTNEDNETEMNSLMMAALSKLPLLPFAYLMDMWRYKVFSGEIAKDQLNSKWWEFRLKYQGVCPPVRRSINDFDAAAKFHIVAGTPYIRYFVSIIIQFQFHKSLCKAAGHKGPLHQCDIYQNKDAGKLLSKALRLGNLLHWTEVMKIITRGETNRMDAGPLLEYFEPLIKWLKKQNKEETVGWRSSDPMICP